MSDVEDDDDERGGGNNEEMGQFDERGFPINMTGAAKLAPQHNPMQKLAAERKKKQEAGRGLNSIMLWLVISSCVRAAAIPATTRRIGGADTLTLLSWL